MTSTLIRHTNPLTIPQEEAQPGLVQNNAGGFVHEIDKWTRLNRFLTIGVEGGTFYVNERQHTLDNVRVVDECLAENFGRTIDTAVEISQAGRAPKNDYALYVLAKGASYQAQVESLASVRQYALDRLPLVARTGTHLFQFVAMVDTMRGWGTALREAVANWYLEKGNQKLAYQVTKYQQREKWSHRDVLRKAHPRTLDAVKNSIFNYITSGELPLQTMRFLPVKDRSDEDAVRLLSAVEEAKTASEPRTVELIREYGLTREMVNTKYLNSAMVWEALSYNMPYTALIRNLGNMTKAGVIAPNSPNTLRIASQIRDAASIRLSRVHPIQLLMALRTYHAGHGYRGSNTWDSQHEIVEALDEAFYTSFRYVEPTGKRFLLGLDVSGSMGMHVNGPLTAAEISAAMLMTTLRTEEIVQPMAFNHDLTPLKVNRTMSLENVLRETSKWNGGATDCASPMRYALANNIPVDVFVVYTDNETWAGHGTPSDWIKEYRRRTGIDAKLVVVGIASTGFSIADPQDAGMLDVAGFDAAVPSIISQFAKGEL